MATILFDSVFKHRTSKMYNQFQRIQRADMHVAARNGETGLFKTCKTGFLDREGYQFASRPDKIHLQCLDKKRPLLGTYSKKDILEVASVWILPVWYSGGQSPSAGRRYRPTLRAGNVFLSPLFCFERPAPQILENFCLLEYCSHFLKCRLYQAKEVDRYPPGEQLWLWF